MRARLKLAQSSGKWICVSPVKGRRSTHSDGSNQKGYYKSPIHCYYPPNYTPFYHKCSPACSFYTNHYHDSFSQQLPSRSRSSLWCATRPVTGSYPELKHPVHTLPPFLSSSLILFYHLLLDLPISLPCSDFPIIIKYPFPTFLYAPVTT